jgi:AP-2 complex subunit mu-1
MEGTSFAYIRHSNVFFVAATRANPNTFLMLEYLFQKLRILQSYLGEDVNDEAIQSNFTLVYELFDETMDYGYPQNCAIDVLRLYINLGSVMQSASGAVTGAPLTSQITGAIDWRREGIRYRKNEVHIDVHEIVTLITSSTGTVLRAEVQGKVMMKTQLTGMPECKFGLNDKLIMDRENGSGGTGNQNAAGVCVEIDDCTFHRYCFV